MKVYTLKRSQFLPITVDEAWDYFSSPMNLQYITPEKLGFEITSKVPGKMHAGLIIHYFVRPIMGLRIKWVTEISHVHKPFIFVDEQRVGPYKMWHHQHKFTEVDGGIIMEDEVNYALPMGILGRLFHAMKVRRDIRKIFDYRNGVLQTIFPPKVNLRNNAA